MIKIHLSRLLGEKKWKQSDLKRKTGIRANTISDYFNEYATAISLEHLESMCIALDCDISDLLELKVGELKPGEGKKQ